MNGLFWGCALLLLAFLPRRLNDIIYTQQHTRRLQQKTVSNGQRKELSYTTHFDGSFEGLNLYEMIVHHVR